MSPQQFEDFVRQRATAHGVPPELAVGIWRAESGGKVGNLVGDNGRSVGPWQVLDATSRQIGLDPADRADPVKSTNAVMPMIKRIVDRAHGDWALSRLGYMRGEGAMSHPQDYAKTPIAGANMRRFAELQSMQDSAQVADAMGMLGIGSSTAPMAQPTMDASPVVPLDATMFADLGLQPESDTWPPMFP